jgi:hypothetical protein
MTGIVDLTKEAAREGVQWYFAPVVALARRVRRGSNAEKPASDRTTQAPHDPEAEQLKASALATPMWRVDISPSFEDSAKAIQFPPELARTLTLLIVRLSRSAEAVSPIPGTNVRVLSSGRRIILSDGTELAPLAIFYSLTEDRSSVHVLDVMPMESQDVRISHSALSELLAESVGDFRTGPAHRWVEGSYAKSLAVEAAISPADAQLVQRSTGGTLADIITATASQTAA